MTARSYGRAASQARPVKITPNYLKNPLSSVLCEFGETKVLCTVSIDDGVPGWMRGNREGWLTAEYALLPGSTLERSRRERPAPSGRTFEIQRLIGRSLRAVINFRVLGEKTITVDCDVLQADGGTRTASVTGAYVALKIAVDKLLKNGKLKGNPLTGSVAAISVGVVDGQVLADLDYTEDLGAEVDFNVVMTGAGEFVEVQGTGEKKTFSRVQLNQMLDCAQNALVDVIAEQNLACD